MSSTQLLEHESVTLFREYLRIPTVQPNVDYSKYLNCIINILPSTYTFINIIYY